MESDEFERAERDARLAAVLRGVLGSSRHAGMLVDAVAVRTEGRAVCEVTEGGDRRRLLTVDDGGLVPWPLVDLVLGRHFGVTTAVVARGEAPPRVTAKLGGLRKGEVRIADGETYLQVKYGDDGTVIESQTGDGADGRSLVVELEGAQRRGGAHPIERVAEHVATLEPGRHAPARLLWPQPAPMAVEDAFARGLAAAGELLWRDGVPAAGGWLVVDAIEHRVVAVGAGREEALARWRAALADAEPPCVEAPAPEDDQPAPPDRIVLRTPAPLPGAPAGPVPAELVPALLLPVPALPPEPCPFASWVRVLDAFGRASFAARRTRAHGYTLVSEELVHRVDPARLEAQLDACDAAYAPRRRLSWPEDWPRPAARRHEYVWRAGSPRSDGVTEVPSRPAREAVPLDNLHGRILRMRYAGR